jgi:N,N'-diacetyllegionaminate synthase
MSAFEIEGRMMGLGQPCYLIAEGGVNHNGDIEIAKRLIDEAKAAAADAIKFQSFTADSIATKDCPKAMYQSKEAGSQRAMLSRLEIDAKGLLELRKYANQREITLLSSPFDLASVDIVDAVGIPAFKIGSGEISNTPLLQRVANKGKPVIMSTGMATLGEIETALDVLRDAGAVDIALLHCVSEYPSNPKDANLLMISTLWECFGLPTGFSDHTKGFYLPLAAVTLGACIIEKHLTLDKGMKGPDHKASMEPSEFKEMSKAIREIESALGDGVKRLTHHERSNRDVVRKSIVAKVRIPAGKKITAAMLTTKRPGTGIPPANLELIIGSIAKTDIEPDRLLDWTDFTITKASRNRGCP